MASHASTLSGLLSTIHSHSWLAVSLAVLAYLALVRHLRYRNLSWLQATFSQYLADPHSMDYKTAHRIIQLTLRHEFPFVYGFSLQWALVKSYGIANGTQLLVQTRRLTNEKVIGKRSEDTGIFLYELLITGIDSERGLRALSKMNWIHSRYGSKISNGDLIHTLALFVLEPQRWIEIYEWRPMSELEKVAVFVYWKEIGNRMGMQGLPQTLSELKTWTAKYEENEMVYSENNAKCYKATVDLFLRDIPSGLRGPAGKIADSFLEDYVRPTLGVAAPPAWATRSVAIFFACRKLLIRHCFLPRFSSAGRGVSETPSGRLQRKSWAFEPWYVEETIWVRFLKRLGLASERSPGSQYLNEGYLPEELGPLEFATVSRSAVLQQASQMKSYAEKGGASGMGCPFAFAR